jgi:hypothetical protein
VAKKTSPENSQSDEAVMDAEVVEDVQEVERTPDDATTEEIPDPIAEPEAPAAKPVKSTPVPLVLGGVAAAIIGFGVAQIVPNGWPISQVDTTAIEETLNAHSTALSGLEELLHKQESLVSSKSDSAAVTAWLAALEQLNTDSAEDASARYAELSLELEGLAVRLEEIEKRPISENASSSAAIAAYERELTGLRETLEAQKVQIEAVAMEAEAQITEAKDQAEALQAGATATANAALLRASLSRIDAALDSGSSFDKALQDVARATGQEPSAELVAAASSGVTSLADLRRTFPAAARDALASVAGDIPEGSTVERFGAFLRAQTGARSLSPRDGTDADAILSRAEAFLGSGDLTAAVEEIASLPPAALEAVSAWQSAATYRMKTQAAVETFATQITEN